jgi:hypothetical protein
VTDFASLKNAIFEIDGMKGEWEREMMEGEMMEGEKTQLKCCSHGEIQAQLHLDDTSTFMCSVCYKSLLSEKELRIDKIVTKNVSEEYYEQVSLYDILNSLNFVYEAKTLVEAIMIGDIIPYINGNDIPEPVQVLEKIIKNINVDGMYTFGDADKDKIKAYMNNHQVIMSKGMEE